MPTPVPSEEQQNLAKQLYKRPSWHYMIFGISAFLVGEILPIIWFSPAQLATIIDRYYVCLLLYINNPYTLPNTRMAVITL